MGSVDASWPASYKRPTLSTVGSFAKMMLRIASVFKKSLVPVMFESLLGGVSYMISQTPEVAVDCQIFETIHGLRADWVYPDGLFDEVFLREQFAHYIKRITEVWENE